MKLMCLILGHKYMHIKFNDNKEFQLIRCTRCKNKWILRHSSYDCVEYDPYLENMIFKPKWKEEVK